MKSLRKILFWSGIFLVILTNIIIKPLGNLDEIWNFNFARCISNGLVPYKDISMVITPLVSFLSAIFLKIFGSELFVTRVLAAILAIVNLGIIYKICTNIGIKSPISKVLVLVIMYIMTAYFCLDYNFFILTLALIIILLEVKNNKQNQKNKKIHILIGILSGLSIITKQTIGLLICGVCILNQLFFIKEKSDFKFVLKNIRNRAIGIIIPIIIFFIYLIAFGAFNDFIDYCILGVKTFSNNISYTELVKSNEVLIKILSIAAPIILIIAVLLNIVYKFKKMENKIFFILTVYCIPTFIMVYPIADNIHFLISIVPIYILVLYSIKIIINKIKFIEKINFKYVFEFIETISFIFIILFTGYIVLKNRDDLSNLSKYKSLNHFYGIKIDSSLLNTIKITDEYINKSDKRVYILDASAAVYMIPINRYNKNYDMFCKGNLGGGSEEKQIEIISQQEDTIYLILNSNYSINWQTPTKVIQYVKENFTQNGTVGIYDIYEKAQ